MMHQCYGISVIFPRLTFNVQNGLIRHLGNDIVYGIYTKIAVKLWCMRCFRHFYVELRLGWRELEASVFTDNMLKYFGFREGGKDLKCPIHP